MPVLKYLIVAALLPAPALAAGAPPGQIADEHRLSPAEVERLLEAAAIKANAASSAAPLPAPIEVPPRPIQGEIGVAIGTGGYREAFGSAVVPIGQDGVAIVSFDQLERNRGRKRRR